MSKMLWPVQAETKRITSPFGPRVNPVTKKQETHYGIDIPAASGTPIRSVLDGICVAVVGNNATAGNTYIIKHGDPALPKYSFGYHCATVTVKKGAAVKRGEVIATVGSTGQSTGPHLHYGLCNQISGSWPVRVYCIDPAKVEHEFGTPSVQPTPPATNVYIVKAGDNMTRIARSHGVTLAQLLAANTQIKNPNVIRVGQKIKIPQTKPIIPPPLNATTLPVNNHAGRPLNLKNVNLYGSATSTKVARKISGTFYIYDGVEISGRYRITNSASRVGKKPVWLNVTGFISKSNL